MKPPSSNHRLKKGKVCVNCEKEIETLPCCYCGGGMSKTKNLIKERLEKLKVTYSNDMGTWKKTITELLHDEAVDELIDFIREENKIARRETIVKVENLEVFADEHDQDVQTGIDIVWEHLQKLKELLK